jgi:hypothetical protein
MSFCLCGTYGAHFHNTGKIDLSKVSDLSVRCKILKNGVQVLKKYARPKIIGKWSTRFTFEQAPTQGDVFQVEAQLVHKLYGPIPGTRTLDLEYDENSNSVVCSGECADFVKGREFDLMAEAARDRAIASEPATRGDIWIVCPVGTDDREDRRRARAAGAPTVVGLTFCVCGGYGSRHHARRLTDLSEQCRLYIVCEVKNAGGATLLHKHVRPEVVGKWSCRHTFDFATPGENDLLLVVATLFIGTTPIDHDDVTVQFQSAHTTLECGADCRDYVQG